MAKKESWYQKEQKKNRTAAAGDAPVTRVIPDDAPTGPAAPFDGVPSRDEQAAASEKAAASAPGMTEAEKTSAVASSGDAKSRVAPSAPGSLITTKDGTFTQAEWAERNKKQPVVE